MRPSNGTISAQVWEIADRLSLPEAPANRGEVIKAVVALGVHEKTASTQFGAWKRHFHPDLNGIRRRSTDEQHRPGRATPNGTSQPSQERHWASLLKNGFSYASDWKLSEGGDIALDRPAPGAPGVYVFVQGDQVVYIGTTRRRLADRMADYRRGHSGQRTSARIKTLLIANLRAGHEMRVLFAVPGETSWNELPVEIAAGLEAGLIARFQPEWNKNGL